MDTLIAVEPLRVEHRPFSHENRQHHVGITITHLTLSCHPHQEYLYNYIYIYIPSRKFSKLLSFTLGKDAYMVDAHASFRVLS